MEASVLLYLSSNAFPLTFLPLLCKLQAILDLSSLPMFTSFFEIEEEEKPTPTFEAIGESTSSLLECIIRLEHKELHCTIERER